MRGIDVARRAKAEIRDALAWSRARFGALAQRRYAALIKHAQRLLVRDPQRPGVQRREHFADGVFLFHLRHARERGQAPKQPRHFIVFTYDDATLTILRVLHDSMDIEERGGGTEE